MAYTVESQWDQGVDGYLNISGPQFILKGASGETALTLKRTAAKAVGIIIAVYEGDSLLFEKPEEVTKSKYLMSGSVSVSFTPAAGKSYVCLCSQAKPAGPAKAYPLSLSTTSGTLETAKLKGKKMTHSLQWRKPAGNAAEHEGPQFFLKLTKKTKVRCQLTAKYADADATHAHRFTLFPVKKPNRRVVSVPEEGCHNSVYLLSNTVDLVIDELAPGLYNILVNSQAAGTCVMEVVTSDDMDATLGGEEYSGPPKFTEKSFQSLIDPKKTPSSVNDRTPVPFALPLEEAKKIVDQVNRELKAKECFKDHDFGHDAKFINTDPKGKTLEPCEWTRPAALFDEPCLFSSGDGANADDIHQGSLGNCWFCASLSALSIKPSRVTSLFYPSTYNPKGIYLVKLYLQNEWRAVIIDDFLPTRHNSLAFVRSDDRGEIWLSLLEKTAAKLQGAYQQLMGRYTTLGSNPVLAMFTGGQTSHCSASEGLDNYWAKILEYCDKDWLVTTGTGEKADKEKGIVAGHAYTVIDAKEKNGIRLVRLRNTWGRTEWTGAWSDGDAKWKQHPDMAKLCGQDPSEKIDDGAFWMSLQDFSANYTSLNLCKMVEDDYPNSVEFVKKGLKRGDLMSTHAKNCLGGLQVVLGADRAHANMNITCTFTTPLAKYVCNQLFVFPSGPVKPVACPKAEAICSSGHGWTVTSQCESEMPGDAKEFIIVPSLSSLKPEEEPFDIKIVARSKVAKCTLQEAASQSVVETTVPIKAGYKKDAVVFKLDVAGPTSANIIMKIEGEVQGNLAAISREIGNRAKWPTAVLTETKFLRSDKLTIDQSLEKGVYYLWICQQSPTEHQVTVAITSQAAITMTAA